MDLTPLYRNDLLIKSGDDGTSRDDKCDNSVVIDRHQHLSSGDLRREAVKRDPKFAPRDDLILYANYVTRGKTLKDFCKWMTLASGELLCVMQVTDLN